MKIHNIKKRPLASFFLDTLNPRYHLTLSAQYAALILPLAIFLA